MADFHVIAAAVLTGNLITLCVVASFQKIRRDEEADGKPFDVPSWVAYIGFSLPLLLIAGLAYTS